MRGLILVTFALLVCPKTMACEIELPDEALLMNDSSAIFEAVLLKEGPTEEPSFVNDGIVVSQTFEVEVRRVWKGDVAARVIVSRMDFAEPCVGSRVDVKYEPRLFTTGERLIIYASSIGSNAYSMLRLGYFVVGPGLQPSLLEARYGKGTEPKRSGG